ncbi:MAG: ATP-binding protein [Clostridiaceae bacterium]|nr:ATP-binding protein [Clostridiaceae bacterium]
MAFSSIIGQNEAKGRLGAALTGSPGHAYIFAGPKGIGKTTLATAFAKALLCEHPSISGSCDQCPSCHYFDQQAHPDFRNIRIDGKEKVIKVERVRQSVCADLNLQPQLGKRKVYLLAGDDLNEQGQNALLKSLEEPPEYACFLITAVGTDHLLATIVSRAGLILLRRSTPAEIETILSRQKLNDSGNIAFYARFSGGLPGVAIDLAGSDWFGDLRRETVRFYSRLSQTSRTALLTSGYQFFDDNRPHAQDILDILSSLIRDQLITLYNPKPEILANPDCWSELAAMHKTTHHAAKEESERLTRAFTALLAARRGLALNASFESLICHLLLVLRKELSYA